MADIYYDDKRSPIATTIAELIIYFKSFPGTSIVKNVPFLLSCPMPALISMQSANPNLPAFIYKNGLNPANRIYLKSLPVASANLSALCNGVNTNTLVPRPVLGAPESILIVVPIPVLGTPQFTNANSYVVSLLDENGWSLRADIPNGANNSGIVTLNISASHPSLGVHTFTSEWIASVSLHGIPLNTITFYAATNPNLPAGSILQIDTAGKIYFTGTSTAGGLGQAIVEIFNLSYNING